MKFKRMVKESYIHSTFEEAVKHPRSRDHLEENVEMVLETINKYNLVEAIEKGIKVYNVEVDGLPEVGRPVIAFVDSHDEYQIITRQDKDLINKKGWSNNDLHTSSDGEFYSGKNDLIYDLSYTEYIYVDDLKLVPQKYYDKVEKDKQDASERKQQLTNSLIKLYGEDLGRKLSDRYISVKKDGGDVEIRGYADYLVKPATYCSAISELFKTIERDFGVDTAKQVVMMSPTLQLPHNTTKYKVPLGKGTPLKWNSYLYLGYSTNVVDNNLIFTQIHSKADSKELLANLRADGYVDAKTDYSTFNKNYVLKESVDLLERKKKKGIHINKNAGNVEYNVSMFNKINSPTEGPSNNPVSGPFGGTIGGEEAMREGIQKKETIELEYDHLKVFIVTKQGNPSGYYNSNFGNWLPDEDEGHNIFVNYTYKVDKDDVLDLLEDIAADREFSEDQYEAHVNDWTEFVREYVKDNFDTLLDEYMKDVLEHFESDAQEEAEEYYNNSNDYDYFESLDDLKDDEEVFMEKYIYDKNDQEQDNFVEDIEDFGETEQEFSSAATSINGSKLPAIFKLVDFHTDTLNLDYGGGKFDNATEYLKTLGVTNLIYDKFNRTAQHNQEVISAVRKNGGADTCTLSNVLNVIKEESIRHEILVNIHKLLKSDGILYITVFEGQAGQKEGPTKSGYQLARKTADYVDEVADVFGEDKVTRRGKLIVARK